MRIAHLAGGAVLLTAAMLAAGCSGSSSNPASTTATGSTASASTSASASASASVTASTTFVPITEPWDPGHAARSRTAPASCGSASSTLAIEQCYEAKTENVDATIDAVQRAKWDKAPASGRATIMADDHGWLAARTPVCAAGFRTGGTIDEISASICLLAESTARLDDVRGITPPLARLAFTDSQDPNEMAWYTTPRGSRITMTDTQGDTTGGIIVAWTVIGGADGFVVNPKQFYYQDGSFTDPGIVDSSGAAYHRVGPAQVYQFSIDYSTVTKDPGNGRNGSYYYVPGTPVAAWGS